MFSTTEDITSSKYLFQFPLQRLPDNSFFGELSCTFEHKSFNVSGLVIGLSW
jgi:hypothetical protein